MDNNTQSLLTALQLADSFFPVGMYAHSQGLEGMVNSGLVQSAEDVAEFLENQFRWSVLPSDGVALLESFRAAENGDLSQIVSIDQFLLAMKTPAELRAASTQFGRRILKETEEWVSNSAQKAYAQSVVSGASPGNGAVALGVTGSALGLSGHAALMVFCHSHAVAILGAASRLMPFPHTQAQAILRRLHPLLGSLTREIWDRRWKDMTAFTPEQDLIAMNHESDELRLFAS